MLGCVMSSQGTPLSPLRRHAADALRRARKLPVGPSRNDLRQLAFGLRFLEKQGLVGTVSDSAAALQGRPRTWPLNDFL
jgi:hypothetical protein